MLNTVFAAMEPLSLDGNAKLAVAIIYGIFLGILLIKCDFADRMVVRDNLTFKSMKMLKTLLFALPVGMILFALLRDWHVVQDHYQKSDFWGVLLGGIIFGIGLGLNGLTPVTSVSALASGRIYALWCLLGMALALPVAAWIRNICADWLDKIDSPVNEALASENGFWVLSNPALWIAAITFVFFLLAANLGVKDKE